MKKKLVSAILCVAMVASIFTACGKKEETLPAPAETKGTAEETEEAAPTEKATEEYTIGVLMKQNADTFVKNIADAVQARGDELEGVKLLMNDAEGDVNQQISQCESLIAQDVDAIILNAMDAEGCNPIVDMCNEAGIPIIECNTLTTNEEYTCYIGSDDVDAGKIQSGFLKEVLPDDAKICIMYGPIGQSPQVYRKQGYEEGGILGGTYEVLQDQTANWKRDEALTLAEDWLTRYPDLNAIVCQNDDMAMGALEAVEAAGRKDDVVIVGIDAIDDAVQAVKDGRLDCTVYQDSKGQGATSVDVALKLAKGESVEKEVMIPFQLVTVDNVDDFIN